MPADWGGCRHATWRAAIVPHDTGLNRCLRTRVNDSTRSDSIESVPAQNVGLQWESIRLTTCARPDLNSFRPIERGIVTLTSSQLRLPRSLSFAFVFNRFCLPQAQLPQDSFRNFCYAHLCLHERLRWFLFCEVDLPVSKSLRLRAKTRFRVARESFTATYIRANADLSDFCCYFPMPIWRTCILSLLGPQELSRIWCNRCPVASIDYHSTWRQQRCTFKINGLVLSDDAKSTTELA